jgi:DNA-binding transcriptional MerR regulator
MKGMLKIGEFSRLSQVTVKTLHHYDDLGLLRPAHIDQFTGYRCYTVEQLSKFHRIMALKELGLSLEQIGLLFEGEVSNEQIRGMLRLKQAEIQQQLGEETAQDIMVIDMDGISYEMCPRYPDLTEDQASWEALAGKYGRYGRLPSGNSGREKLGEIELTIVDDRPHMSGAIGPVLPTDDETIIILSGPFNGETITYDRESGFLYHQGYVYKPE